MSHGGLQIALYGAMGALGEQVMLALESEGLSATLTPVGAEHSTGSELMWRGKTVHVVSEQAVPTDALDAAILAIPTSAAARVREELVRDGVLVIDASSDAVQHTLPLIWPQINSESLQDHPGAFALPSAVVSTIAPILAPFWGKGDLARVDVLALAGASAGGKQAEKSFADQTLSLLGSRLPEAGALPGILAFNVLSDGGDPEALNSTVQAETERLLGPSDTRVYSQLLHVPVFAGLTCAISLHFTTPMTLEDAPAGLLRTHREVQIAPAGVGLRDALEREDVTLTSVSKRGDRVLTLVAFADPLTRTATAAVQLLIEVVENDLW